MSHQPETAPTAETPQRGGSWRAALPGILAGATAPFLPLFRVLAAEENRALFFFRHTDAWALAALLGSLAVVFAAVWLALTHSPGRTGGWLRRLAVSAVIGLALMNVAALFQPGLGGDPSYSRNYLLLGALTLGIGAWGPVFEQFRRVGAVAAKLGAPLPLIILVFLLTAPEYHESREPSPFPDAGVESDELGPVYIFLFDGLDRRVAADEEGTRARYPALHAFIDEAVWFENSFAPGQHTYLSVPRLLFQTEANIVREDDGSYKIGTHDSARVESIFTTLDTGRTTGVVGGWYLDYGRMLGDQADWIRDSSYSRPPGKDFGDSAAMIAFYATEYGFVPLVRGLAGINDFMRHGHAGIARDVHAQAQETIESGGDDVVAFFHYPVPHAPYLFDRDGMRDWASIMNESEERGYRLNLEYTDRLLGELLDTIRDSGRWDDATIVVTSDHGLDKSLTNVLAIKLPGESGGRVVNEPFSSAHLVDWLRENGLQR